VDHDHRRHTVVELCIRDLNAGVGLRHCPSGKFAANAAWLLAATLAHNLLRWVAAIALGARDQLVVAKTIRRTLLALPRRITRSARRCRLHLPAGWLAVGGVVRAGTGPAALHRLRHLTHAAAERTTPDPSGSAGACPNAASKQPTPSRSSQTSPARPPMMPPVRHQASSDRPDRTPTTQELGIG
jgi:hypothetical protein